jgi:radical SAM superfamily enzyme YgiQ (UPF0313 family)
MRDLTLIFPPHPWQVDPHAQAPIGLLYVAAAAERSGISVALANLTGAGLDPAGWRIPPARVYGIGGTYLDIPQVNALAEHLKRTRPDCRVIAGGPLALSEPEISPDVDTIVLGEAEEAIVDAWHAGAPRVLSGVPSDVNAVHPPARHLWAGPFGGNIFAGHRNYFGGGSTTILSSRGCPFACAFCASPALTSRKVRFRDPAAVVAEMEQVARDYGVRQFRFSDEFLTAKRSHIAGLCDAIRGSGVLGRGAQVAWRASIGANPHDDALFRDMASAGCREVAIGVESADPKVLGILTNKATTDDCRVAMHNARRAGLTVRALMMTGLPGESRKTVDLMRCFVETASYDVLAVGMFGPVPGCAIYERPADFGCRLIPERARGGFYLYGPAGANEIEPTIDIEGLDRLEHAAVMREIVAMAKASDKVGKG